MSPLIKEDQRQNQTGGRDFCFLASPDPFIRPKTCKSAIPLGHDHLILDRYRYTGYTGNICASKQHTRAVQDSNRPNDWKKSALNIIRTNQTNLNAIVTQHLIYCKHARCIYIHDAARSTWAAFMPIDTSNTRFAKTEPPSLGHPARAAPRRAPRPTFGAP
jgi:hypothetical protein